MKFNKIYYKYISESINNFSNISEVNYLSRLFDNSNFIIDTNLLYKKYILNQAPDNELTRIINKIVKKRNKNKISELSTSQFLGTLNEINKSKEVTDEKKRKENEYIVSTLINEINSNIKKIQRTLEIENIELEREKEKKTKIKQDIEKKYRTFKYYW